MITIPKENNLYHLSYDLMETPESEEDKNNKHLQFKKDVVWEIFIQGPVHYLKSPVASTIIFDSSKDFDFWHNHISNFADRIFFVLSEVSIYSAGESVKEMSQLVHPNNSIESNFKTDVVDAVMDEQLKIKNNGRAVKSKF